MLEKFISYINIHYLVNPNDKILIATSGGIDSMVLIDLFIKANIEIGIIHLNHNLRAEESMQDELFIKDFCSENDIPFYLKSLDINRMVKEEKENMHQLARRERYIFFRETMNNFNYQKVATAHHSDDKIEGFFLNLFRGSGLKGLTGIDQNQSNTIRPILFAQKDDIKYYARNNQIKYREDSSNASTKYSRNYIRHKLIPIIAEIKPSYQKTISSTIDKLDDSLHLLNHFIKENIDNYLSKDGETITIHLDKLYHIQGNTTLLYHLVSDYGFSSSQVSSILKSYKNTGAIFESKEYQAVIDRKKLLLKPKTKTQNTNYLIELNSSIEIEKLGTITSKAIKDNNIELSKNIALLNIDKLVFPLTIRKWKAGDRFQPHGMNGRYKKIKKYLTDIKLSRFEKDQTYVLLSEDNICWLIGYRVDERFVGEGVLLMIS